MTERPTSVAAVMAAKAAAREGTQPDPDDAALAGPRTVAQVIAKRRRHRAMTNHPERFLPDHQEQN